MPRNKPSICDTGFYMRIRKEDLSHMRDLAKNAGKKLTAYIRDCALTAANHRIVTDRESESSECESESYSVSVPLSDSSTSQNETKPLDSNGNKGDSADFLLSSEQKEVSRSLLIAEKTGHRPRCRCDICNHLRSLCTRTGK